MRVEDVSMAPRLAPGDRLFVDPRELDRRPPMRGDVVVFPDPDGSGRWLVKEVAAVGPVTVHTVRSGVVARLAGDSRPAPDDAIESTPLPEGHIFVLSTGAAGGRDSRSFGPVPTRRLVGVAWWRYAPSERRGPLVPAGPPSPR